MTSIVRVATIVVVGVSSIAACRESGSLDGATPGTPSSPALAAICPTSWSVAPDVDPSIARPPGDETLLLHVAAKGTQDYRCDEISADGGARFAWVFMGPRAELLDCGGNVVGQHAASEGGPTAPVWQTVDKSYMIGKKRAAATPDGGPPSVPWLLLEKTISGGAGALARTRYVHRVHTSGGVSPAAACDGFNVRSTESVPYTADYYFYGR